MVRVGSGDIACTQAYFYCENPARLAASVVVVDRSANIYAIVYCGRRLWHWGPIAFTAREG